MERVALRIVVIQQTRNDLAVRLREERVALFGEEILKLGIVFDYPVVDNRHASVGVRVRVHIRRFSVSCPPRMTYSAVSVGSALAFKLLFHCGELSPRFHGFDILALKYRYSRAVITAVLQLFQAVHQHLGAVALTEITYYSAHNILLILKNFKILALIAHYAHFVRFVAHQSQDRSAYALRLRLTLFEIYCAAVTLHLAITRL